MTQTTIEESIQFKPQTRIKLLIAITTIAVLIRIAAALFIGNNLHDLPGVSDQITYHTLGIRLVDGFGYTFDRPWWPATHAGEPTAHWSYLYTSFVALNYLVTGPNPIFVRLIQVLIVGILQTLLLYKLGKTIFNTTVGLVAALLGAFYIYFVYYSATLMTEPFYITCILAVFYISFRLSGTPNQPADQGPAAWRTAAILGLVIGLTLLLRQVFLLFLPFLFGWILYARRKNKPLKTLLALGLSTVIVVAMIVPFSLYNYARFHTFVLLNTNAGFAFYWGNHPVYGTHFESIITPETGNYLELLPLELKGLNEAELDRELLKRGIQFVIDDPGRYVLLSLSRIPAYFMFWPSAQSSLFSNLSRVGSFGILLPFMLYGLALPLARHPKNRLTYDSPVFLLLLFMIIYTAVHILTWTLIRYRLPIDAILLVFAALGITDLLSRLFKSRLPLQFNL